MSIRRAVTQLAVILGSYLLPCMVTPTAAQSSCLPVINVTFANDGLSVYVESDKDLSNVVLKFCNGTPDYKFDNLSGLTGTFSYQSLELAGVWVKSGCNQSGDGPGYGEFFGRSCGGGDPDPTPTPTATATATPTPEPKVTICHIPPGNPSQAQTIEVDESAVAAHLAHGDILGACPVDCGGATFGSATVDQCGVCGGNNTSCADCAGVPNGGAVFDVCGVCGGTATDPNSCDPCEGTVDRCGVCNGKDECVDCADVPNGGAQVDCCGVCQGKNKSCLGLCGGCNTLRIRRSWLQSLAGLVNSVRISSAKELRCTKGSVLVVNNRQDQANQLFQEGVSLAYALFNRYPALCGVNFCQSSAADSIRLQLESVLAKLYNLNREAKENAAKGCGRSCKKKSARR